VTVPHLGDQYYHGYRIEDLGVGPPPILLRMLTARKLSDAILRAVTMGANAAAILES
jgi:UDP:flavonoid glycosyltransferase YjiC (YdhE family)